MATIKAISLKQPWAHMIRVGEKTIETRRWYTSHRGPLLICSSKRPKLPGIRCGYALAICDLVVCRVMMLADREAACCNWYPGAFAWVLGNLQPIEPFPVTGRLRLFKVTVPDELLAEAMDGKART